MKIRLHIDGFSIQTRRVDVTFNWRIDYEREDGGGWWFSLLHLGVMTDHIDWLIVMPWISYKPTQIKPILILSD